MKDELVLDNLKLIYESIKQLHICWIGAEEFQEYYDAGLEGLIVGARTYKEEEGVKPCTYLMTCIKNSIKRQLKLRNCVKRKNKKGADIYLNSLYGEADYDELLEDKSINIQDEVEQKICVEEIITEINKMSNIKDALVLKMYFGLEGFTARNQAQISEILNISQTMVRMRLNRGIKTLREKMKGIENVRFKK